MKTSAIDPIPQAILTVVLNNIVPSLTQLINLSYPTGMFPENMKQATITPLLKKPSLDKKQLQLENFRPVSNLPLFAKLLERVTAIRLHEHKLKLNAAKTDLLVEPSLFLTSSSLCLADSIS